MTQSQHNLVTQPLETIPSNIPKVLLFYRQKQGTKLEVRLEGIGDFSESLQVELINQRGDLLVTPAMVNSPKWTGELSLEDIQEGSYLLRVLYQNYVLEETTFELLDESSLEETDEFYQGLGVEDQVTEALENGNYTEAMELQEKAAQCYQHNPELAARSWEELAEKLYEKQQFLLSKKALNKALEIYSNIKELENKEEILTGIKNQLKIVNEELDKTPSNRKILDKSSPVPYSSNIKYLREKKGYSYEQLAFLTGKTPEIIQAWEKGSQLESLILLQEISQCLNCKIDNLITQKLTRSQSNIKSLREERQLSQGQLALLLGKTPDLIEEWETGKGVQFQEFLVFFELAKHLNCSVQDLMIVATIDDDNPAIVSSRGVD